MEEPRIKLNQKYIYRFDADLIVIGEFKTFPDEPEDLFFIYKFYGREGLNKEYREVTVEHKSIVKGKENSYTYVRLTRILNGTRSPNVRIPLIDLEPLESVTS